MNAPQIHSENVKALMLDPENPRLPVEYQGKPQRELLEYFARHEAVEDLMGAIGKNDFFPGEPLVVYRNEEDPKGKYRVIEGNRRLASVMLLGNPGAYASRPTLREIAEDSHYKPTEVPVVHVEDRESALPYLGSRHIIGVKAWEPLQKARYMRQLFAATSRKTPPTERYREVARRIGSGSRRDYIKKNLDALAVYELIRENDYFGDEETNDMNFSFGVLYTAIDYRPISGFLGVVKYDGEKDEVIKENHPILDEKVLNKKNVSEFYSWVFQKDNEGKAVLGESRNLPKLSAILRSRTATEALKRTRNLDVAYESSEGAVVELEKALARALKHLRYANSIVANVDSNRDVESLARSVLQQAKQVVSTLAGKDEDGRN